MKKGQSKPGVKFSKVNRVQSEDGGEEDDDSCIDSEDSSMSVDRPPKSLVWKDRNKSRKVSKIRTVSTIHRTMRMELPTEDTTDDTAPQPNVSNTADEVNEEQAPPESTSEPTPDTSIPQEANAQPSAPSQKKARMVGPPRDGLPGYGMHRSRMYLAEHGHRVELNDNPQPRRSPRVSKRKVRTPDIEQSSSSKLPEHTKDDESTGDERTRNSGYPKFSIDEFEEPDDYINVYIRYRIAGGRMKISESDTGSEEHYPQFPGIELDEIGDWNQDYNNIAPCEWTMRHSEYIRWFVANHPQPVDIRQATRFWLDRREMLWRRQHPTKDSYEEFLQKREFGPGESMATSRTPRTHGTKGICTKCT